MFVFGYAAELVAHDLPVERVGGGVGVGGFAAGFAQRASLLVRGPQLRQVGAPAPLPAPVARRRLVELASLRVDAPAAAQRRPVPRVSLQHEVVGAEAADPVNLGPKHEQSAHQVDERQLGVGAVLPVEPGVP